jgi:hypothetical protein
MSTPRQEELLGALQAAVQDLAPERRLELIEHLVGSNEGPSDRVSVPDPEALRSAHSFYEQSHEFQPGQLVRWKPRLRNKRLPEYGEPAIVIDVLDEPVLNIAEPADSPYYREPLSLVLGVFDGAGDLVCFHFDAQRFEPALDETTIRE